MLKIKTNDITAEEFFNSSYVQNHIKNNMDFLHKSLKMFSVPLDLDFDKFNPHIAFTDNQCYFCNAGHPHVCDLSNNNLEEHLTIVYGLLFHEIGHRIFTHFTAFKASLENLESGILYPSLPSQFNSEQMNDFLESDNYHNYKNFIVGFMTNMINIIEDERIELLLLKRFSHFINFANGLAVLRQKDRQVMPAFDNFVAHTNSNAELILSTVRYIARKQPLVIPPQLESIEYRELINTISPIIQDMVKSEKTIDFYMGANKIFYYCIPFLISDLKTMDAKQSSNNENSSSKDEDFSFNDLMDKIPELLDELLKEMNVNKTLDSANDISNLSENIDLGDLENSNFTEDSSDCTNKLISITHLLNQIKADNKEKADAISFEEYLNENYNNINNESYNFIVPTSTVYSMEQYKLQKKEICKIANRLAKDLIYLFLDSDDTLKNRYSGYQFNPESICRSDFKNFSVKNNADEITLSVTILLDESGSMSGKKYDLAKFTLSVLMEFCKQLTIPFSAYGFNTTYTHNMYVYADAEKISERDLYKIFTNHCVGSNYDGHALDFAITKLSKQSADNKICFIISDGFPSNYHNFSDAQKHIKSMLTKAQRENITVISVGIDQDKEQLLSIYGSDKFLDISNMKHLSSQLINILTKFM